jgi:hypothetical protein
MWVSNSALERACSSRLSATLLAEVLPPLKPTSRRKEILDWLHNTRRVLRRRFSNPNRSRCHSCSITLRRLLSAQDIRSGPSTDCFTTYSHLDYSRKRKRFKSSRNSSQHVKTRRLNTLCEVWKASFVSAMQSGQWSSLWRMRLSLLRRRNVSTTRQLPCTELNIATADKRWNPEKLTARLQEGGDIIKSVYRYAVCVSMDAPLIPWQRASFLRGNHPFTPQRRHRRCERGVQAHAWRPAQAYARQTD